MIKIEYRNQGIKCVCLAEDEQEADKYIKNLFKRGVTTYRKNGKLFFEGVKEDAK